MLNEHKREMIQSILIKKRLFFAIVAKPSADDTEKQSKIKQKIIIMNIENENLIMILFDRLQWYNFIWFESLSTLNYIIIRIIYN